MHDIGDVPGADYDSRHGSRDPDAQRHAVPLASDGMYGAPDEGAPEREQLWLQSQPPLTPHALGDGIRTGVVTGGRALDTRKPPALVGVHNQARATPRLSEPSAADCGE